MFKRILGLVAALSAALLLSTTPASAAVGNAHFVNGGTDAAASGSSLVVHFKEAGLASGSTEYITTTADASVTYECVNGGSHNPSASNKTTTQTTVTAPPQPFTADKNGNVTGTQTLSVPTAQSLGFSCPKGQTMTLVSVAYTGVTLTDTTSGATTAFTGPYTYTNLSAP
ncbi:hypothetical protein [Sinomonas sp. B1-1]|uniref:hypothetical protein n=1 Tax=Sinomonas sp. B1-1 TaxID=3141454 RepID=UPI003D2C7BEF